MCASHGTRAAIGPKRRDCVAWLLGALAGERASALVAPAADKLEEIHLVSDAWHGLTRRDGTGLYFDLIRAVYARRQIRVRITVLPYVRTIHQVRNGQADAWVASFLNEQDFPLYPKWHFDRNAQWVVYLREPGRPPFRTVADLRGQRVAWLRGFNLDRYIAQPMRATEVDSIDSALAMLKRRRLDYFVGAESDIRAEMVRLKVDETLFERRFLMHLGLYLAFANNPRGDALRRVWDEEMAQLHGTPAFRALYDKAGYPHPF